MYFAMKNRIIFLIDFWIDFWTILEAPGDPATRSCGMRGAWLSSFEFKEFEEFSRTVQTRSDPSGGGGLPSPSEGHRRPPLALCISGCQFAAGHLSRTFWMEF